MRTSKAHPVIIKKSEVCIMWQFIAVFVTALVAALLAQHLFDRRVRRMFLLDKYEKLVERADMIVLKLNSVFDYVVLVETDKNHLDQFKEYLDILKNEDLIRGPLLLELSHYYNEDFYEFADGIHIFTLDIIGYLRNSMLHLQKGNEINKEELENVKNSLHDRYGRLKGFAMDQLKAESRKNILTEIKDIYLGIRQIR